jgi:hypothetical protein
VDADGDLLVSQEKSATKESLWDIVASILLFPKIKLLTGIILNLVEEYLHHVIDHVTKKIFKKKKHSPTFAQEICSHAYCLTIHK